MLPGHRQEEKLRLVLPAETESLARIRRELEAHASKIGLSAAVLVDLKTVVSEACANVVHYAYDIDAEGPLEVELFPGQERLTVFVRDSGDGLCPRPDSDVPTMKLGLPLIGALSNRMTLTSVRGQGTELEVEIATAGQPPGGSA